MFQYTREIIINDQVFKADSGNTELLIENVGSYKKGHIVDVKHLAAVPAEKAKIALSTLKTLPSNAAAGDVVRFTIKMNTVGGDVDAILANYTTLFKRGIVIEVAQGASETEIQSAIKAAFTGLKEWPVRLTDTYIEAKTPYLAMHVVTEVLTPREGSISEMKVKSTESSEEQKGVIPFGTYETLISSHRLPTLENLRWGSEAESEMPIKGKKYDLVEFKYVADRNIGGFDVLGQKATSVTTHRFWVREDKIGNGSGDGLFLDLVKKVANNPDSLEARVKALKNKA